MGVVVALRFCEGIYRGSLLGLQRQVLYNTAQAALATLRHLGAVGVLAWIRPSVHAFFLWQAAVSLLTVLAFGQAVHRTLPPPKSPPRFSREALRGVWKFASGVMGITLLGVLLTQMDKVLLSRLLSLQTFGYYTLAATMAGALYMIIGPITQAAYPRMVELSAQEDQQALTSVYHRGAQLVSAMTAPPVALLTLFSGAVVFVWSGDADLARRTAPILTPLILGTFLNGLMWMPYQLQLAHGWTSLTLKVNTVAVIVLAPAIVWIVPRYGAVGAAWVWVALNTGYVIVAVNLMHRRLLRHEKWRWYSADTGWPTAAALTVASVALSCQPAEYQNRITWLAFLLLGGGLAFLASVLAARDLRVRVRAVVNRQLGGRWL
jgi:O-antigen/teichoic acid export membrane protein